MVVNLNRLFDTIINKEGITLLNGPMRTYRVVIPYLASKRPGKLVLYSDKNVTEKFSDDKFEVKHYSNMNVSFVVWKDFYDYNGKKNDKGDIRDYLVEYTRLEQLSDGGIFTYWFKQIK
jgi:hypothetical protein